MMFPCFRRAHRAGFTMVETVASVAIMGTALVGMMTVLGFGQKCARANEQKTAAYNLLQKYIEEDVMAKAYGWNCLRTRSKYPDVSSDYFLAAAQIETTPNRIKEVTITVDWKSAFGITTESQSIKVVKGNY